MSIKVVNKQVQAKIMKEQTPTFGNIADNKLNNVTLMWAVNTQSWYGGFQTCRNKRQGWCKYRLN